MVICHTTKGIGYGRLEGTGDSHGTPLPHAEYVEAMRKLGFRYPRQSKATWRPISAW